MVVRRIDEINKKQQKRFVISIFTLLITLVAAIIIALSIGHYGFFDVNRFFNVVLYAFTGNNKYYSTDVNVIQYIRLPRTIGALLVGGALSVSGLVYQNIFNNKLVSPDVLGVNSGCCVGAGIAILMGINNNFISIFAFIFGILSVVAALFLPKIFRNKSTITLVLSGIIVGAFMNSIIGLIKYIADKEDKLSTITFWMMGSLSGTTIDELLPVFIISLVCFAVLFIMNFRIDAISLGREESSSIGVKYKANMLIVIICSTLLTAASVSLCGQVGWVGLVIPHITRAVVGNRSKETIPISFLIGAIFMIIVDCISRTVSVDEIPLSIITGILGAVIYTVVLVKKGRTINE